MFVWTVIQGLYLNFWLVVIEIFLPLCIWLMCLILSAFVVVVVTIISLRDETLAPRTYSTGFFLWVSLSFSHLTTHMYECTL